MKIPARQIAVPIIRIHRCVPLDEVHLCKIDLADEICVIKKDGYIGDPTRREIDYARNNGKRGFFIEPLQKNNAYVTNLSS